MKIEILKHIAIQAKLSEKSQGDIANDVAEFFHYQEHVMNEKGEMEANPVSIEDFADQKILEQIMSFVNEARKQRATKQLTYERLKL